MRQLALAKKLLWLTLGSIFITVVVLSSVLWWQLSSSNKVLSAQAEKLIVTEVEEKLTSNAAVYGEHIERLFHSLRYLVMNRLKML